MCKHHDSFTHVYLYTYTDLGLKLNCVDHKSKHTYKTDSKLRI